MLVCVYAGRSLGNSNEPFSQFWLVKEGCGWRSAKRYCADPRKIIIQFPMTISNPVFEFGLQVLRIPSFDEMIGPCAT